MPWRASLRKAGLASLAIALPLIGCSETPQSAQTITIRLLVAQDFRYQAIQGIAVTLAALPGQPALPLRETPPTLGDCSGHPCTYSAGPGLGGAGTEYRVLVSGNPFRNAPVEDLRTSGDECAPPGQAPFVGRAFRLRLAAGTASPPFVARAVLLGPQGQLAAASSEQDSRGEPPQFIPTRPERCLTIQFACQAGATCDDGTNRPPVFDPPGSFRIQAGNPLSFQVRAVDPDGDPLVWGADLSLLPAGGTPASFDPATRTFSWTPPNQPGVYQAAFTASDGRASARATATIQVDPVQSLPVFSGVGPFTAVEGVFLDFTFEVTNPVPGPLTVRTDMTEMPPGAVVLFDAATRTVAWRPRPGDAREAPWVLGLVAENSYGVSRKPVSITVLRSNRNPVFGPLAPLTIEPDQRLAVLVVASDPDGDPFTVQADLSGLPAAAVSAGRASWDAATHTFRFTPVSAEVRAEPYPVLLVAEDNRGGRTVARLLVTVNTPPTPIFAPIPPVRVVEGEVVRIAVVASDARGNAATVTMDLTGWPASVASPTFSQGLFTWATAAGYAGFYRVTFVASDAAGTRARLEVPIEVVTAGEARAAGQACSTSSQCASGFCVLGVCRAACAPTSAAACAAGEFCDGQKCAPIPAPPDETKLVVTMNPPGTNDLLRGLPGAVGGGLRVRVFAEAALVTLIGESTAAADGSFSDFSIGDNLGDALDLVHVVAENSAGVRSAPTAVTNDKTPPAGLALQAPTYTRQATVAVTTSDDGTAAAWLLVEDSTAPPSQSASWLGARPTQFTLSAPGTHTLSLWARDLAGNVSTAPASAVVAFAGPVSASASTVTATSPILADGTARSVIAIELRDANGLPIVGATTEISATGSANTLVQPPATNAEGRAEGSLSSTRAETKEVTVIAEPGAHQVVLATRPVVSFVANPATVSATLSTVSANPTSGIVANGVVASTITVTVRDAHANPVPGQTVSLAVTGTGNSPLSPATTDESGVATFALASTRAETKQVTATVNPGTSPVVLEQRPTVTFVADASTISATQSTVSANPTSGITANGVAASTITVTVRDAHANPVPGQTVSLAVTGTGNSPLSPATTDESGVATFALASTRAETKQVTATVNPGTSPVVIDQQPSVTFVADPSHVSASLSTVVASPESGTLADGQTGVTITVTVVDQHGNPVPGLPVEVSVTGCGNLLSSSVNTNAQGIATFTLATTRAQTKTVRATVTSTAGRVSLEQEASVGFLPTGATIPIYVFRNGFQRPNWRIEAPDGAERVPGGSGNRFLNLAEDSHFLAYPGSTPPVRIPFEICSGQLVSSDPRLRADSTMLTLATQPVTIEVNGYDGPWNVTDENPASWVVPEAQGSRTLHLLPGDYRLTLGTGGVTASIPFSLDAAGQVASADARVTASGSTLTLRTTPVTVVTNGFEGPWYIQDSHQNPDQRRFLVRSELPGTRTIFLPDATFLLTLGWRGRLALIPFTVSGGRVQSQDLRVEPVDSELRLRTTRVTIDFGKLQAQWRLRDSGEGDQGRTVLDAGLRTRRPALIPGDYQIHLGWTGRTLKIPFTLEANGEVSSPDPAHVTASGTTIALKLFPVRIDPNGFDGQWRVTERTYFEEQFLPWGQGERTAYLPAAEYSVQLPAGLGAIDFTVTEAGELMVAPDQRATHAGNTLIFTTSQVTFDMGGFLGAWRATGSDWNWPVLPGPGQPDSHGDRLGRLVDGSYKLVFVGPPLSNLPMIDFSVQGGNVSVPQHETRATGAGSTFSLVTRAVTVDMNRFPGRWSLSAEMPQGFYQVLPYGNGTRTVALVDGSYRFEIGCSYPPVHFRVSSTGVSTADPRASASAFKLTLNTTPVTLDPQGLTSGASSVLCESVGLTSWAPGVRTTYLPDGVFTMGLENQPPFTFTVESGTVTEEDPRVEVVDSTTLRSTSWTQPPGHRVWVDPRQFRGSYLIRIPEGETVLNTGDGVRAVDLPEGAYQILLGASPIGFTVAQDGSVSSSDPRVTMETGPTLRLRTTAVTIDLGRFGVSEWWVKSEDSTNEVAQGSFGSRVLDLHEGSYQIVVGNHPTIPFSVTGSGVTCVDSWSRATCAGATVTLKTFPIRVQSNGFRIDGYWVQDNPPTIGMSYGSGGGDAIVHLPPSATGAYRLFLDRGDPEGGYPELAIPFQVDPSGSVTSSDPRVAGSTALLALQTEAVAVDMSGYYAVAWTMRQVRDGSNVGLRRMSQTTQGDHVVHLLRGNAGAEKYSLYLGSTTPRIDFELSGSNVVSADPQRATGGSGVLTLVTRDVLVDMAGFPITAYRVLDHPPSPDHRELVWFTTGDMRLRLLDGQYALEMGGLGWLAFQVSGSDVTPVDNRVLGGPGTLTLRTHPYRFDPAGFKPDGYGTVDSARSRWTSWATEGPSRISLIDGDYGLAFQNNGISSIPFSATSGVLTTSDPRAQASGNSLSLRTWRYTIDPSFHEVNPYWVDEYGTGWPAIRVTHGTTGISHHQLIDGDWRIDLGNLGTPDPYFLPFSTAQGTLTTNDPRGATASGATLTMRTTPVALRIHDFEVGWVSWDVWSPWGRQAAQPTFGEAVVYLVDGTYVASIAQEWLTFIVWNGTVGTSDDRASATETTLDLRVCRVAVAPSNPETPYFLTDEPWTRPVAPWASGARTLSLIRGNYLLRDGANLLFAVALDDQSCVFAVPEDGGVSYVTSLALASPHTGTTYTLTMVP
jgi:hypothetical protein